jgi:hypothetical protein
VLGLLLTPISVGSVTATCSQRRVHLSMGVSLPRSKSPAFRASVRAMAADCLIYRLLKLGDSRRH